MCIANELGINHIVTRLLEYEKEYGERFTPSNLLVRLNEANEDFNTGEAQWKH